MSDAADCTSCTRKNEAEDMVQCDKCQKWLHYTCAGVDGTVANRSWECIVCTELNATVRNRSPAGALLGGNESARPLSRQSERGSVDKASIASTTRSRRLLKLEMSRLEEQKKLDLQFLQKEKDNAQEYLRRKFEILAMEEDEDDYVDDANSAVDRVVEWANNVKPQTTDDVKIPVDEHRKKLAFEATSIAVVEPAPLEQRQISARQVLSKELPSFSGSPEEWPLFISSYEHTTKLCGFSDDENLCRLQRAIKGSALRAVGSRLMLPSSVQEVISELRMLYGRPTYIVQTMLTKIRAEPAPKVDRLETLVQYALSVRSLKCTMQASGLTSHLNDPTLLQELVDKLPAPLRLNWALDNGAKEQNLTQFSDWLYKIAEAASTVTTFAAVDGKSDRRQAHLHAHSEDRASGSKPQSTKQGIGCYLCDQNHRLVDCERFKQLNIHQKWELTRNKGLCERCLGHPKRFRCRSGRACGVNGCTNGHHFLLHFTPETPQQPLPVASGSYHAHQQVNATDTLFNIVPVVLYGNGRSLETFAFLDNGSSLTLVEESIADSLGLNGVNKPLCLKWTSDTTRLEEESKVVPMEISGVPAKGKYWLRDVRTIKKLALPVQSVDKEKMGNKYSHLCSIPLQSYKHAQCGILIGINNQRLILAQQVKVGSWNDPVATKTRLGWCVSGSNVRDGKANGVYHTYEACDCNRDLNEMVRQHFILEDLGTGKYIDSKEDIRAKGILSSTVMREGDSFSSGLLWKYDDIVLPESYSMALKRLKCLEKKMEADSSLLEIVSTMINDFLAKGYARKLSQQEVDAYHPRCWYLPTFIVRNQNKPGKVRLVWDAAATTHGVSLNSMLLKGPDELRVLTEVLYGFRTRRVAIAGDIEEMFHRVGVQKDDQHSQRFLWRNGISDRSPDVYVMEVLTFGATCSPCIAQHVKNVNAREFANIFPRASESIIEHHYVDDLLDSVDTVEEAIQLAKNVKFIHSKGGFNIRNWLSNSKQVLQALNQSERMGKTFQEHPDEMKCTTKVLGLWWNTVDDSFTFSLRFTKAHEDVLKGRRMPTKRELLRVLMSIYDPLGFLSFYLFKLKVLLQEVWKSAIDWDEVIPHNIRDEWEVWRALLPKVEDVCIPRCYLPKSFNSDASVQLHVFVDASENAMAAVAYLRYKDGESVDCTIVGAKCKVAPLKPLSIPRLELQAALIGSRLADTIVKSHAISIERRFLWTDSRNVLSWLQADAKRFKPFVMFRVGEILEHTQQNEWKWIPTKMNVADLATKWAKTPTFHQENRWFKGPEFLYDEEGSWPVQSGKIEVQKEEIRPQFLLLTDEGDYEPVIDIYRFSTWRRLVRSMGRVFRFANNARGRCSILGLSKGVLSTDELKQAEMFLLRMAQKGRFADEIAMLKNEIMLPKSSTLFKLSPYLDGDGLLRLKGRIDSAWCVDEVTKRPMIMPKDHYITLLLVAEYHNRFHHRCQETVVNEVRQKFWIPSLRTLIRTVRRRCQVCRNNNAVPRYPEMAPLPEARMAAYVRPFSYTGVDYFGPILIVSGRRTEKRWGVLFTCLTIRAIHIEVANTLSADSCIMCVRNFMSRRGTPREIYSDNGTNFKGAEKELRDAYHQMNKEVIQNTFTSSETRWLFNPPAAPHMGGCWERLIGSVKRVLKEITGGQRLEEESLRAVLIEVEGIINSRPLTHVSVDSEDAEALTPNHFLLGSSCGSKPPGEFNNKDLLRKSWRVAQQLSNMFWRRWIREYLPTLTRRTKWFQPVKNVEKGDVVIIVDENLPRSSWPKGVVVSTVMAKDGQTRRATVRTATGFYDRPVVKLAVLDVGTAVCEAAAEAPASPGGRNVTD